MVDEAGNPLRDDDTGMLLKTWVEEPIDPLSNTIELLRSVGMVGGEKPAPPPTADEIAQAIAKTQPKPHEENPEVIAMRKDFQEYVTRQEKKEGEEEAAKKAVEQTMSSMKPYLDELKEMKTHTGLSDHQYEMQHQENLQKNMLSTMREGFSSIRGDLQPLMLQLMVTSLKAAGLQDSTIGDLIQRMQQPGNGHQAKSGSEPLETMRNWTRE